MTAQTRIEMVDADQPEGRGFASRKFVLAVFAVLVTTGLLWAGKLTSANWVEAITWTVGLYMLGNGASAWAAVWGRR